MNKNIKLELELKLVFDVQKDLSSLFDKILSIQSKDWPSFTDILSNYCLVNYYELNSAKKYDLSLWYVHENSCLKIQL